MQGTTLKAAVAGGIAGALVAGSTAAVAGTGIGQVFNLGKTNSVNATSALVGSSSGTELGVRNSGAKAGVRYPEAGSRVDPAQAASSARTAARDCSQSDPVTTATRHPAGTASTPGRPPPDSRASTPTTTARCIWATGSLRPRQRRWE